MYYRFEFETVEESYQSDDRLKQFPPRHFFVSCCCNLFFPKETLSFCISMSPWSWKTNKESRPSIAGSFIFFRSNKKYPVEKLAETESKKKKKWVWFFGKVAKVFGFFGWMRIVSDRTCRVENLWRLGAYIIWFQIANTWEILYILEKRISTFLFCFNSMKI